MSDLQCSRCKQWKGVRDFRCTGAVGGGLDFSDLCHECEDPLDSDTYYMNREDLIAEVKRLRTGIRKHRDATGHELCWFVPELWDLLPEKVEPKPDVPPEEEFIAACRLYRKSLDPSG